MCGHNEPPCTVLPRSQVQNCISPGASDRVFGSSPVSLALTHVLSL